MASSHQLFFPGMTSDTRAKIENIKASSHHYITAKAYLAQTLFYTVLLPVEEKRANTAPIWVLKVATILLKITATGIKSSEGSAQRMEAMGYGLAAFISTAASKFLPPN